MRNCAGVAKMNRRYSTLTCYRKAKGGRKGLVPRGASGGEVEEMKSIDRMFHNVREGREAIDSNSIRCGKMGNEALTLLFFL